MIINRTCEYKRINTLPIRKGGIDVFHIRTFLDEIYKSIKLLHIKQEKLKLPSFESKSKKRLEIRKMNDLITSRFKEVESLISEINTDDTDLNKYIINYFNTKLKTILLEYKKTQQKFLEDSVIDIIPEKNFEQETEYMADNVENVLDIQKNIYEITNYILEMKMLIHLGSNSIDRLDLIFETTCEVINNGIIIN